MKKMRKILATIVSLCLVLAMMPTLPVFADGDADTWDGTATMDWIGTENTFDEAGTNTNTTAYNGKYYNVKNYSEGTVFVLDSAEDLAGLAAIMNVQAHKNAAWFLNCTFIITKNLDLQSNTAWKPIGLSNDYEFCGTLKGSLGDATGASNESITISNMIITSNNNMGLVSTQSSGGIQNITINGATLTNTTTNAVGSFVGYIRVVDKLTTPAPVYKNLKSNATIVNNATNGVSGGIIANNNRNDAVIENCEFTGSITNKGTNSGGIVGYAQQNIVVKNCNVTGTISSATNTDPGTGGIVGRAKGNVMVENSYVGATLTGKVNRIGGFVGWVAENKTATLTNCHFDGIVAANGTQSGAFLGRVDAGSTMTTVTMENCLNTGASKNTYDFDTSFSWIGLSANHTGNGTYKFTNCYSNIDIPFAGRCDYQSTSATTWKFNINGTEETIAVSSTADFRGLAKFKPTSLSFFEMKPEKLTGFDFTNVWTVRDGKIPTLKSAADSASDTYAYADLSFFKVNTTDKSVEALEINDEHELLGLLKLSKVATDATKFTVKLSRTLDYTGMGFSEAWETALASAYVGSVDTTGAKIVKTALQKGNTTETASSIRLVAEISGKNYDAAGFDVLMSYVDANGVTHYSKAQTVTVTKCYTSLLANGAKVEPESGNYFIIVEITDPLVALDQITVTFNAFVTEGDATTYSADVLEIAL